MPRLPAAWQTLTPQRGPLGDFPIFEGLGDLFAGSPDGQYDIDLYAQYAREMSQIALDDPGLMWDAAGTLQNFLPGLEALVTGRGGQVLVTQQMVDDVLDIWQRLATAGRPSLAKTIHTELANYNDRQDFVGMSFND